MLVEGRKGNDTNACRRYVPSSGFSFNALDSAGDFPTKSARQGKDSSSISRLGESDHTSRQKPVPSSGFSFGLPDARRDGSKNVLASELRNGVTAGTESRIQSKSHDSNVPSTSRKRQMISTVLGNDTFSIGSLSGLSSLTGRSNKSARPARPSTETSSASDSMTIAVDASTSLAIAPQPVSSQGAVIEHKVPAEIPLAAVAPHEACQPQLEMSSNVDTGTLQEECTSPEANLTGQLCPGLDLGAVEPEKTPSLNVATVFSRHEVNEDMSCDLVQDDVQMSVEKVRSGLRAQAQSVEASSVQLGSASSIAGVVLPQTARSSSRSDPVMSNPAAEPTHRSLLKAGSGRDVPPKASNESNPRTSTCENKQHTESVPTQKHVRDVERSKVEFGKRKTADLRVETNEIEQEDLWKQFTPDNIDYGRCLSRTWSNGCGNQCTRLPLQNKSVCRMHESRNKFGTVDGPIPDAALREFVQARKRESARAADTKSNAARTKIATPQQETIAAARGGHSSGPTQKPANTLAKKARDLARQRSDASNPGVPYGANYVKQDLRRRKRTCASAGVSKEAKMARRHFGKNGRLKKKHMFGPTPDGSTGNLKKDWIRHKRTRALADTSLVDVRSEKKVEVFSSAVTSTLLETLPEDAGVGVIAESRPPDATEFTTAAGRQDTDLHPIADGHEIPNENSEVLEQQELSNDFSAFWKLPASPDKLSAENLKDILRGVFGHDEFRPGQLEAMLSILSGQRTLLLLATGSGKSLCYQIPAFLLRDEGITLVVSPLISLMSDQLLRLPNCLRGAILNSTQSRDQQREVMRAVRARLVDVLFVAPERLSLWSFDGCGLPPIALACVDEAHCVSEWSHNFRPDYLRLEELLMQALGARRLLALTATATRPTIKSVSNILSINTIIRSDHTFTLQELLDEPTQPQTQRPNLTMDIRLVDDEEVQTRELVKILTTEPSCRNSAVVYVWKKMTADDLAKRLRFHIRGEVRSYHGGMLPDDRRAVQDRFMTGLTRVVVATMAFGMGLDKPDIRTVIHFNIPKSIENYIQETGRGSRDGGQGRCITLVNPRDYKSQRWVTSGAGATGKAHLARRLLTMVLLDGPAGPHTKHKMSVEAMETYDECASRAGTWCPYNVAFEEKEMALELGCGRDELHSMLAHLAYRSKGYVQLYSSFPTKMKLRFFGTGPDELMKQDAFLRKVLPFAKKSCGVHSLDLAHVLAQMGGSPGDLSNALWGAKGDDYTMQKTDYGYMLSIWKELSEAQVEEWADQISAINVQAHNNSLAKLDAMYVALNRATESSQGSASIKGHKIATADSATKAPVYLPKEIDGKALLQDAGSGRWKVIDRRGISYRRTKHLQDRSEQAARQNEIVEGFDEGDGWIRCPMEASTNEALNVLIDAYFRASPDADAIDAVSGGADSRQLHLLSALGGDYQPRGTRSLPSASVGTAKATVGVQSSSLLDPDLLATKMERERASVHAVVARLVLGSEWPELATNDPVAIAHVVAQFLAGIDSDLMPARKWRKHASWGRFQDFGDFDALENLVTASMEKIQSVQAKRKAAADAAK